MEKAVKHCSNCSTKYTVEWNEEEQDLEPLTCPLIDTAEGAHKEIENILQRMREVSVQAANDTNNDQDRKNLQAEMNALITEIDRIAGTTTWAGEKLMEDEQGSFFSFQVGAATGDKNQTDLLTNTHSAGRFIFNVCPTWLKQNIAIIILTLCKCLLGYC